MTRKLLLLGLVALLAACDTPAGDDSTTTSTSTTSSTSTTTSTTTTTTSTSTSTSTTTVPTTTTTLVEGNWGAQPLVTYEGWGGIALGWWDGSAWVHAEEETVLPVSGGEDYQVALLGSEAVLEGTPAKTGCDVVITEGLPGVQFDDGSALYATIDDGSGGERIVAGVAITAPWDITPHPVTAGEAHPDLEAIAVELLRERGYDADRVEIVQTIDADIDGDEAIETFIVAEETELANSMSGVYSILFAVSPSWDGPEVIAESVIPSEETGYPESYRLSAVADLSGDGKMEMVVDGLAWENSWVVVHEMTDSGFVERIGAGCGV